MARKRSNSAPRGKRQRKARLRARAFEHLRVIETSRARRDGHAGRAVEQHALVVGGRLQFVTINPHNDLANLLTREDRSDGTAAGKRD